MMAQSSELERGRVSSLPVQAANWLWEELSRVIPIAVFFLTGFSLVLLIVKLSLAQYSIEVSTVSRALLGALISSKVVLVLNRTPLARGPVRYPRAVSVLLRTFSYGLAVIALGLTERVIDARRDHGGLIGATSFVATQTDIHRLAAVALGIALVFCAYFVLTDI